MLESAGLFLHLCEKNQGQLKRNQYIFPMSTSITLNNSLKIVYDMYAPRLSIDCSIKEACVCMTDVIWQQVYSNDKYRSVEHRVVVNENRARYSFPLFFNPAYWVNVSPFSELIDKEHPARYRSILWGKYIRSRMDGNFKHLGVENRQIYHYAINSQ